MPASYQTLPDASYNGAFPPPPQQPTLTRKFAPYALLAGLAVTGFSLSYGAQPPPLLATATATSDAICTNGHYSKTTLKPAITYPFISLFPDTKGANKFEGSDVIYKDGMFYAIADSLWSILAVSSDLEVFSSANTMIGDPFRESDESGYEAIFNVDDMFYITRESVKNADGDGDYHAVIEEVTLDPEGGDYTIMNQCESSYVFEGDSKGFEGAVGLKDAGDGELYYLGLCEGNHCKEGGKGKEKGNGKLVVMRKTQDAEGCKWDETRTIDIPPTAHFQVSSNTAQGRNLDPQPTDYRLCSVETPERAFEAMSLCLTAPDSI